MPPRRPNASHRPNHAFVAVLVVAAWCLLAPVGRAQVEDPRIEAGRLMVRGMTRSFLGDHEGAVALFERAAGLVPDDAAVRFALAEALAEAGRTEVAREHARRAGALDPDRAEYAVLAARLTARSGDVPGALAQFDSLRKRHPDELPVHLERARLLAALEQRTAAIEAYREMAARWILPDGVLEEHVEIASALGASDEVLVLLDALRERRPGDGSLLRRRGETLVRSGRVDEAAAAFEAAVDLDPTDTASRSALVALYAADPGGGETPARRLAWAERLLADEGPAGAGRVVERLGNQAAEGDLDALHLVGLALRAGGDPGRAAERLRQVTDRDPGRLAAWVAVVEALRAAGDPVEAWEIAEEAILFFPGNVELSVQAGAAALESALPREAERVFRVGLRALEEQGEDDPLLATAAAAGLGRALALAGRADDGLALLQPLLADLHVLGTAVPGTGAEATEPLHRASADPLRASRRMDLALCALSWTLHTLLDAGRGAPSLAEAAADLRGGAPGAENPAPDTARIAGSSPSALALAALQAWLRGDARQALVLLSRSGAKPDRSPALLILRGDLRAALEDVGAARADFEAALALVPTSPVARGRLDRR